MFSHIQLSFYHVLSYLILCSWSWTSPRCCYYNAFQLLFGFTFFPLFPSTPTDHSFVMLYYYHAKGIVKEASASVCPDTEIAQHLGVEVSLEDGRNTKRNKKKHSANDFRGKPVTPPNDANISRKRELDLSLAEGPEEGQSQSKKKKIEHSANDLRGKPITPPNDAKISRKRELDLSPNERPEEGQSPFKKKKRIRPSANDLGGKLGTPPMMPTSRGRGNYNYPQKWNKVHRKRKNVQQMISGSASHTYEGCRTENTKKEAKVNGTGPSVKKASRKGSIASTTHQEAGTTQGVCSILTFFSCFF